MLPDRVSNPGPLTYESGALPIALRGPASINKGSLRHFVENAVRRKLPYAHTITLTQNKLVLKYL